ncbi:MAG: hypothetical protein NTZ58_01460 [Solirubrobacterales bacterium]|nr:hypothetical protein [Solirubrobacterales bacterium]
MANRTAADEILKYAHRGACDFALRIGDQRRPVDAERERQQQLGVERSRRAARRSDCRTSAV